MKLVSAIKEVIAELAEEVDEAIVLDQPASSFIEGFLFEVLTASL